MDLNEDQDNQYADEDELFAPIEPIAPLSPIGPIDVAGNLDLGIDSDSDQTTRNRKDKKKRKDDKDDGKPKKPRKPGAYMNLDRLGGPRGLKLLPGYFNNVKFHGKGHEREDLDKLLGVFEDWAQYMFPKHRFIDVVDRIERFPPAKVKKLNISCGEIVDDDEKRNDEYLNQAENENRATQGNEGQNSAREENLIDDDFDEIDFDDLLGNVL